MTTNRAPAFISLLLVASCIHASGTPAFSLSTENDDYKVILCERQECDTCPNKVQFSFTVHDKKAATSYPFTLQHLTRRDTIESLLLWQTKLAIIATYEGKNVYNVSVVDLNAAQLEDIFSAYKLSPSPSNHLFAYVKGYTRHSPSSEIVVLYDLAKAPSDNRLPESFPGNKVDTGLPIYPEENVHPGSYDQTATPEHAIISPILWAPDERTIVFFDIHGSQNYIVTVDLTAGPDNSVIRRRSLDPKLLIRHDLPPDQREFHRQAIARSRRFPFAVQSLTWHHTGTSILVTPVKCGNPWIVDEIVIPVP